MRASIAAVAAGLLALACLGCTTSIPAPTARLSPVVNVPAAPIATPSDPPVDAPLGLPVDPSIEPVSLSNPSAEAARALRFCGVGSTVAFGQVSGMGRIHHARDAVLYVPLTGRGPEIASAAPAWIITFRGMLPMPKSGEEWVDATCIVVGGTGGFYATGPVQILSSGATVTPLPAGEAPSLALPPLLP